MYYSYLEIEYIATSFSPARTDLALKLLKEHDGNNEPLSDGNKDDDDKYDENGDIPGNSAPPAESIACLRPASQRTSMPSR